jgi:hypothetical protein
MDAKTDKSANPVFAVTLHMNRGTFQPVNRCHYFLQIRDKQ